MGVFQLGEHLIDFVLCHPTGRQGTLERLLIGLRLCTGPIRQRPTTATQGTQALWCGLAEPVGNGFLDKFMMNTDGRARTFR